MASEVHGLCQELDICEGPRNDRHLAHARTLPDLSVPGTRISSRSGVVDKRWPIPVNQAVHLIRL